MRFWVVLVACLAVAAVFVGVPAGEVSALKIEVDGDVVVVTGTMSGDTIGISRDETDGSMLAVSVDGEPVDRVLFPAGTEIVVRLMSGDDYFEAPGLAGYGSLTVYGSLGDDEITGGSGTDFLDGGFGNDVLKGANGNDVLVGGHGNDDLYGGDQSDSMFGGPAGVDDHIDGGQGVLDLGLGPNVVNATKAESVSEFSEPAQDFYYDNIQRNLSSHAGPDETVTVEGGEIVVADTSGAWKTDDWSHTVSVSVDDFVAVENAAVVYQNSGSTGQVNLLLEDRPVFERFVVWRFDEDDTEHSRVTDINYVFDEVVEPYIEANEGAEYIQYYGNGVWEYNNGASFMFATDALDWHGADGEEADLFREYEQLQNIRDAGGHLAITRFGINPDAGRIEVHVDENYNGLDFPAIEENLSVLGFEKIDLYLTDVAHAGTLISEDTSVDASEVDVAGLDGTNFPNQISPVAGDPISIKSNNLVTRCSLGGYWVRSSPKGNVSGGITAGHCGNEPTSSRTDEESWLFGGFLIGRTEENFYTSVGSAAYWDKAPHAVDAMLSRFVDPIIGDVNDDDGDVNDGDSIVDPIIRDVNHNKSISSYDTDWYWSANLMNKETEVCVTGTLARESPRTVCSGVLRFNNTHYENIGTKNQPKYVKQELVVLEAPAGKVGGMSGGPVFTRDANGSSVTVEGIFWGRDWCDRFQKSTCLSFTRMAEVHHKMKQKYGRSIRFVTA